MFLTSLARGRTLFGCSFIASEPRIENLGRVVEIDHEEVQLGLKVSFGTLSKIVGQIIKGTGTEDGTDGRECLPKMSACLTSPARNMSNEASFLCSKIGKSYSLMGQKKLVVCHSEESSGRAHP